MTMRRDRLLRLRHRGARRASATTRRRRWRWQTGSSLHPHHPVRQYVGEGLARGQPVDLLRREQRQGQGGARRVRGDGRGRATTGRHTCCGRKARRRASCWKSPRGVRGRKTRGRSESCIAGWGDGVLAVRPEGRVVGAAATVHGADRRGVRGVAGTGAGGRDAGDDEHGGWGWNFAAEPSGLRFHDPVMGRNIPTRAETVAGWERAERLREQEKQARQAAEARVAELEALLGGSTVEIPECDPAVRPTTRIDRSGCGCCSVPTSSWC